MFKLLFLSSLVFSEVPGYVLTGPVFTEKRSPEEIQLLSKEKLEHSVRSYYRSFFYFYRRRWAESTGKKPEDLPMTLAEQLADQALKLPDDKIRELTRQFYHEPNGVEQANIRTLAETNSLVIKWEEKKFGKMLPRKPIPLQLKPEDILEELKKDEFIKEQIAKMPVHRRKFVDQLIPEGAQVDPSAIVKYEPPAAVSKQTASTSSSARTIIIGVGAFLFLLIGIIFWFRKKNPVIKS